MSFDRNTIELRAWQTAKKIEVDVTHSQPFNDMEDEAWKEMIKIFKDLISKKADITYSEALSRGRGQLNKVVDTFTSGRFTKQAPQGHSL